jgi:hypothetical protein
MQLNPNFPLDRKFVIPAKAGIQMIKKTCEAGQNKGVDRCAMNYFCWIPAFAGMTGEEAEIIALRLANTRCHTNLSTQD